jgi:hypothetical protein
MAGCNGYFRDINKFSLSTKDTPSNDEQTHQIFFLTGTYTRFHLLTKMVGKCPKATRKLLSFFSFALYSDSDQSETPTSASSPAEARPAGQQVTGRQM